MVKCPVGYSEKLTGNTNINRNERDLFYSLLFTLVSKMAFPNNPTGPFTISGDDQEISEFYAARERHTTNYDAPNLFKGSSGIGLFLTDPFKVLDIQNPLPDVPELQENTSIN